MIFSLSISECIGLKGVIKKHVLKRAHPFLLTTFPFFHILSVNLGKDVFTTQPSMSVLEYVPQFK